MGKLRLIVSLLLIIATFTVYGQVRHFQFVSYDDPDYVTANPHVRAGLTVEGFTWAFTSFEHANWFPLTWISHMLDVQIHGLESGWHHFTNVAIHLCGALLLFNVLLEMTGSPWPSAFAAFLFALHPLHVESVAWVAERKDVLSGLFWPVTLWAYLRYVRRPRPIRYVLVLIAFALGLMSKPMLVTLPFVLLLLDFWPLQRPGIAARLWEKAPLFALALASSWITFLAQQRGGAVIPVDSIPFAARVGNAFATYLAYLMQTLWPAGLAVFYPHPIHQPGWRIATAAVILVAISALAIHTRRTRPYLLVGWLWYLGTLVPVIGLVQVGQQSRADRYTYIPLTGIFIMLAWGGADLVRRWPGARPLAAGLAAAICTACMPITWLQARHWSNSETLFRHAIAVTDDNYVAYNGLGLALKEQGRWDEAVSNFEQAVRIRPQYPDAQNNLGQALLASGRTEEALGHIEAALRINPASPEAHDNRGAALSRLGRTGDALAEYREALRLAPDDSIAHNGLGAILGERGQTADGLQHLQESVRLNPGYADGRYNLGWLLARLGRTDEAVIQFTESIRLQPDNAEAHYNLGTALASQGKLGDAIDHFNTAIRLKQSYAAAHLNLGKALANSDRLEEAVKHLREAVRLDPDLPEARESLELLMGQRRQSHH